jgi:hypothetical protein
MAHPAAQLLLSKAGLSKAELDALSALTQSGNIKVL